MELTINLSCILLETLLIHFTKSELQFLSWVVANEGTVYKNNS